MTDIKIKKLPTVEQVEEIMKDWGKFSVEQFAVRIQLEKDVIEHYHRVSPQIEKNIR